MIGSVMMVRGSRVIVVIRLKRMVGIERLWCSMVLRCFFLSSEFKLFF